MMTETKQGTEALVAQLADEIIKRLAKSYDLVYVGYRDELSETQVAKIVQGDDLWLDESWEWEADNRYESAKNIIDELASEIISEWGEEADTDLTFVADALKNGSDEFDRVRYEIEERDTGSWVKELVGNTPNVLLRINCIDEDHGYSFESVSASRVLRDLGVRITKENVKTVRTVLAEASPEYSVLMGYWIVGADVSDIYDLPNEGEVEIVNPYLYLGNPFTGSGFISEQPLKTKVRIKRDELRTDKDAFGYAVDEIYGGLRPSDFECKILAV